LLGLPAELLPEIRKATNNVSEWLREAAQEKLDRGAEKIQEKAPYLTRLASAHRPIAAIAHISK
jgi:hypothetical protein